MRLYHLGKQSYGYEYKKQCHRTNRLLTLAECLCNQKDPDGKQNGVNNLILPGKEIDPINSYSFAR